MTDREMWTLAVATVGTEFAELSPAQKRLLGELADAVKECKRKLHTVAEGVGVGEICASCGGECCMTGKFHVTVVDLLVYLAEGRELFSPRFGGECCPFLGEQGCLMAPSFRPFNCVTFNCERVERLMGSGDKEQAVLRERELRALYGRFEGVFGNRFMGGLLMNCERDILRDRLPILRKKPAE